MKNLLLISLILSGAQVHAAAITGSTSVGYQTAMAMVGRAIVQTFGEYSAEGKQAFKMAEKDLSQKFNSGNKVEGVVVDSIITAAIEKADPQNLRSAYSPAQRGNLISEATLKTKNGPVNLPFRYLFLGEPGKTEGYPAHNPLRRQQQTDGYMCGYWAAINSYALAIVANNVAHGHEITCKRVTEKAQSLTTYIANNDKYSVIKKPTKKNNFTHIDIAKCADQVYNLLVGLKGGVPLLDASHPAWIGDYSKNIGALCVYDGDKTVFDATYNFGQKLKEFRAAIESKTRAMIPLVFVRPNHWIVLAMVNIPNSGPCVYLMDSKNLDAYPDILDTFKWMANCISA